MRRTLALVGSDGPAIGNVIQAHAAVVGLAEEHRRALRSGAASEAISGDALRDALDLEEALSTFLAERRVSRREALDRSMRRLRAHTSTGDLVGAVCEEAVAGCGMQRSLLSRVRDGVWSPWMSHDGEADAQWLPDPPHRFALAIEDMALENTIIETSRPAIVVDADQDERVHPTLRRLLGVRSYVVVPIAPNTTVVGLLHLDRGQDPRVVDVDDEALAWAFAEGFGRAYERALMRERCAAQRLLLGSLAASAEKRAAGISTKVTLDLGRSSGDGAQRAPAHNGVPTADATLEPFTARERDVLLLMLDGLSNTRIAERLVVSPATVKSHVRQILRKVGAVNRVDAIARLLPNTTNPPRSANDRDG